MTDLEITKACAEAMGLLGGDTGYALLGRMENHPYDPLHDDGQAMALVKNMELWIQPPRQGHLTAPPSDYWFVAHSAKGGDSRNADLNRAICECVAKLSTSTTPS
jgi:hypothetical protein